MSYRHDPNAYNVVNLKAASGNFGEADTSPLFGEGESTWVLDGFLIPSMRSGLNEVGHEFGHLLGLDDEYPRDKNGRVIIGAPPYPSMRGNIMADSNGLPWQGDIWNIIANYGALK